MRSLKLWVYGCVFGIGALGALPWQVAAQDPPPYCPGEECDNCRTFEADSFEPERHSFMLNSGSCYKKQGYSHGYHFESMQLGSCGANHDICQTDVLANVQQLKQSMFTGDLERLHWRLQSAKQVVMGVEETAVLVTGCTGIPQTINVPTAFLTGPSPRTGSRAASEETEREELPPQAWVMVFGMPLN